MEDQRTNLHRQNMFKLVGTGPQFMVSMNGLVWQQARIDSSKNSLL